MVSELIRFEDKFIPEPNSGCWLWIGATGIRRGRRYGQFGSNGETAHQVSARLYKNIQRKKGFDLDHLCKTPLCVNPDHLELVTHRENCLRGDKYIKPGQSCIRGHKNNFKIRKEGWKRCLSCMKEDNNK